MPRKPAPPRLRLRSCPTLRRSKTTTMRCAVSWSARKPPAASTASPAAIPIGKSANCAGETLTRHFQTQFAGGAASPMRRGIETATRIVARRRCDMAAPRDHDPQIVRGIHPREAPHATLEKTMTIDERLEALTQSLELIAHMQQAEEKRAAERDAKTDQRISRILDVVEKQAGNIDKLAAIAHDHQQRIERLES